MNRCLLLSIVLYMHVIGISPRVIEGAWNEGEGVYNVTLDQPFPGPPDDWSP